MNVYINGSPVSLTQRDYVASGGEGAVYAKGDIGYKVYHDPKKMLPLGKIRELQQIQNPNVIRPLDILTDAKGNAIGYSMRFIRDAWTLCQLFPKPFRDRNNVTHAMIRDVVIQMRDLFQSIHDAGILIVDANEMNFLVTKDFKVIIAIDADSYQTPSYPATAIMLSVRDWTVHGGQWNEGSDWFSFACVSFQLFTALHPFKGKHPTVDGMEARMKAGISVLDPRVKVPPTAYDFSVIPVAYMAWYDMVLRQGKRLPPPMFQGQVLTPAPAKPVLQKGKGLVVMTEFIRYDSDVVRFWTRGSHVITLTEDRLWYDKRPLGPAYKAAMGCAFTMSGAPVLASLHGRDLQMENLNDRQGLAPLATRFDEVCSYDGRLYGRFNDSVFEIVLTEAGTRVIAGAKVVANVMPQASHLYEGVLVQSMLGACFVSLLAKSGAAYQVRLPELDKYRIMDAKFEGGVLMMVVEQGGKYDRVVYRFDEDLQHPDLRIVSDIQPSGLNFTVLDTGVCVCLNEDGQLELSRKHKDSRSLKLIDDPVIPGDAILGKTGGMVLFAHGPVIYTLKMV